MKPEPLWTWRKRSAKSLKPKHGPLSAGFGAVPPTLGRNPDAFVSNDGIGVNLPAGPPTKADSYFGIKSMAYLIGMA